MFVQMYQEKFLRFPQGKCKALTLSYDDGVQADQKLLALMAKYGVKGTFNLGSDLYDIAGEWNNHMDEQTTYQTFKDCGQEVAMHGAKHVFLDKVSFAEAVWELTSNRHFLEQKFGCIVDGLAYAYNSYTPEVVAFLRSFAKYGKTTKSSYTFALPTDPILWQPTCHHNEMEMVELSNTFFENSPLTEVKHRESWLFYVWGHSYEFDREKGLDSWAFIESFLRRASMHKDEVWFATNGQVIDYINAYKALKFSCDGELVYNPSALSVWVEVRGKTYEVKPDQTLRFDPCQRKVD